MREHYESYWNRVAPPPNSDPLAATRARILQTFIRSLEPKPRSFLDFGCGEGWLTATMQSTGMESMGLDISPTAIDRARSRFPDVSFHVHEIGSLPLPFIGGTYDVVSSFEVIEHLVEPAALVSEIREALMPYGHAAITTPYHGIFKNLALALVAFDKHFDVCGDHIRFFTDRALTRLLESNGFSVVRIKHFGRAPLIWSGVFVWAQKV